MAYRRIPFAPDEWYHLYGRGIDGRDIFIDERDFRRFQALLYLANNVEPVNFELLKNKPYEDIFTLPRRQNIVAVGAYCLMKNHPHLILQEVKEGGTTNFMRKLGTAYTMYFDKKYDRIGNLMVKPLRSKHIGDDRYLCRVVQYVHLNPAELFEPGWKEGKVIDTAALERRLCDYTFSSSPDYFGKERPERAILDKEVYNLLRDDLPKIRDTIMEAALYHAEIEDSLTPRPRGRPKKVTPFNTPFNK